MDVTTTTMDDVADARAGAAVRLRTGRRDRGAAAAGAAGDTTRVVVQFE